MTSYNLLSGSFYRCERSACKMHEVDISLKQAEALQAYEHIGLANKLIEQRDEARQLARKYYRQAQENQAAARVEETYRADIHLLKRGQKNLLDVIEGLVKAFPYMDMDGQLNSRGGVASAAALLYLEGYGRVIIDYHNGNDIKAHWAS